MIRKQKYMRYLTLMMLRLMAFSRTYLILLN